MKKTIWKVELSTDSRQNISLPYNSKILTVKTQNNKPCLWALVEPQNILVNYEIEIYGTDHYIETENKIYIGTFLVNDDSLVFHVFLKDTP